MNRFVICVLAFSVCCTTVVAQNTGGTPIKRIRPDNVHPGKVEAAGIFDEYWKLKERDEK